MSTILRNRGDTIERTEGAAASGRPVLLATLACRIDGAAERMAIESAIDAGSPLLVTNVVRLPNYRTTMVLAGPSAATLPHEEALEEVRATAERAVALGIRTEHLRVSSKRPVTALLEVARDHRAGLIVFGPDPTQLKPRQFRRAAKRIRGEAACLVWVTPDG